VIFPETSLCGVLTVRQVTGRILAMPRRRNLKRPRLTRPNRARHAKRVANLRLQGIAAALGELAGEHREPDLAAMVLQSLGLTVADLEAAGATADDLAPIQAR
jgi:hypothetical protein